MNAEQFLRMAKAGCLVILGLAFFILVMMSFGCATTETVYERVEVPVPYWSPPGNIAPAPPRPKLQAGDLAREEAEADPRAALLVLGQDLSAALAWGEMLEHLYAELVLLIAAEPALPPPSGGSVPPSD